MNNRRIISLSLSEEALARLDERAKAYGGNKSAAAETAILGTLDPMLGGEVLNVAIPVSQVVNLYRLLNSPAVSPIVMGEEWRSIRDQVTKLVMQIRQNQKESV